MKWLPCAVCWFVSSAVIAGEFKVQRFESDASQGRSGAVRVEQADLIYSGQLRPKVGGDLTAQRFELAERVTEQLKSVGLAPSDVVKLNLYVADDADAAVIAPTLKEFFGAESLPAASWVTTAIPDEEKKSLKIAVDFVAARRPSAESLVMPAAVDGERPLAVVPASATSRVFVSGQAEKGDGSVADATKQTMASLLKTLKFLELTPTDVVQVKGFIAPMSKSSEAIKAIREAFAPLAAPPIILVEWQSPSQPVEIELIAATRNPSPGKRPVVEYLTPPEMKSSPVYSKVARVQSPVTIFLSGLYGTQSDPDSEAELRDLFTQTKSLAEAAGSDLKHLVKATYYVSAKGSSDQHNKLRPEYYDPARPPAASKAMVKGVGRAGRTITWDMIAAPKE